MFGGAGASVQYSCEGLKTLSGELLIFIEVISILYFAAALSLVSVRNVKITRMKVQKILHLG